MKFFARFTSWGERLLSGKARRKQPARKSLNVRWPSLFVERLEARELLATPPKVLVVTPPDGTVSTNNAPVMTVQFNEDVVGAGTASNYELVDSNGTAYPLSVTYTSVNDTATISLNPGTTMLLPNNYTLLIRGDQIKDKNSALLLAQPGQLVVANAGVGSVSIVNAPSSGRLNAVQNYPAPAVNGSVPVSVATGDFNGDGIPDLAVLDNGNNAVEIYQGLGNGLFDNTPTFTLNLPTNAVPTAMAVADFNNSGKPGVVVTDSALNQVTVFANTRPATSAPTYQFTATNYAAGPAPAAIAVADLNQDGLPDLAVADAGLNGANYIVSVLVNLSSSSQTVFSTPVQFKVGDNTPSGVNNPNGIAAGNLTSAGGLNDLVVTGSNNFISVLTNTTIGQGGTPTFGLTSLNSGTATSSPAIAPIHRTGVNDIVVETASGPIVFMNLGSGAFAPPTPPIQRTTNQSGNLFTNPGGLAAQDLNGDGLADVVVANKNSPGQVLVLQNATLSGSILGAVNGNGTTTFSPITIATAGAHGLHTGDYVVITGVMGDTAANGAWIITVTDPTHFSLNNSTGNAPYTSGGSYYHVQFTAPAGSVAQGNVTGASNTNPITITTAQPHGLSTGDSVTISGVSGNSNANGTFVITVLGPNSFSLNGTMGNGAYTGGGTYSRNAPDASIPVDANPTFVTLADANGDTTLDVLTANPTSGTISLALGAGSGTFQTSTDFTLNLPQSPQATPVATATGDLNGDGYQDLVVVNPASNSVSVYFGTASGSFTGPVTYSTVIGGKGNQPVSVILANLGGPGLDIVAVSQQDNVVTILANNGTGTFTPVGTVAVGSGPTQVVAGDLNGDGKTDLAIAHNGANATASQGGVSILLSTGVDTFAPAVEYATGIHASAIALGDFNRDGILDFVVANDTSPGAVLLFEGDGTGNFREIASYRVGAFPTALAVGDLNRDGYPDVVAVSGSANTTQNISVLLNSFGGGFSPAIYTSVLAGTPLQSVAITDLGVGAFPDVVVGTAPGATGFQHDNVFALHSMGDGSFGPLEPYAVGSGGLPTAAPSYVGVISDPLVRLTTFTITGTTINTNLLQNGNFSGLDLTGERGNLDGWQTFNEANSNGRFSAQSGGISPLSSTPIPRLGSTYTATLDQPNQIPYTTGSANPNTPASYAGSHALYQDVFIPAGATNVTFTASLYLDNSQAGAFSNFSTLDFNSDGRGAPNQQVRVDVVDPTDNNILDTGAGVLLNIFSTSSSTPLVGVVALSANLSAFAGRTIRLRVAEANNQGRLIVGLTNVKLTATYTNVQAPVLANLALENPGFVPVGSTVLTTTDPTLIGQVGDLGSVGAIQYIEFDPSFGPSTRTTQIDATGHFSATLPLPLPGQYNVVVKVVDKAGNVTEGSYLFNYQGPSLYGWSAAGPQQTDLGTQAVNYNNISGRVTAIAVSPTDTSGNTYYIGSANGGVWKTTDGGNSWTPLTDRVVDASGNPVPESIGGLVQSRTPSAQNVLYAGLGVADLAPDSRAGSGVLKSTDFGATWTLVGQASLAGARISKMGIDGNTPDIVYAAVASGGVQGQGVYKSTDGGSTWTNVLLQALQNGRMLANGVAVAAGTTLPSVTDLVVDPFDSQTILIGLGNIGLVNVSGANIAGFWRSTNGGQSWTLVTGGATAGIPNDTLPSGAAVGRVTIAEGFGPGLSEPFYYVLIGNPPPAQPSGGGSVNYGNGAQGNGNAAGLYKSKNLGSDWTQVLLRQNVGNAGAHNFQSINLLGNVASYVGALAADPSNPNVVYVGGSSVTPGVQTSPLNHGTVRIDTGDMRDTTYVDPNTGKIPNDGDDIHKAAQAEFQGGFYDPTTKLDPYKGEGVYWTDLEYGAFGSSTAQQLPSSVHALLFDSQGRLLVGTDSGIFRGTGFGFGYNFGSVGGGILANTANNLPAIRLTSINGNLQIGDLTSAAVDPTNPATVYTTAYNTGTAVAVGPLTSATAGLTGPTAPGTPSTGPTLNVPTGAHVTTANPLPGSAPGTPGSVFRIFAYENSGALQPQFSIDGGPYITQNIVFPGNVNAGLLPVLVVNPNPVLESGQYQYQAILGTDRVYQTRTSGNAWNDITGRSLTTGHITALAFAATPANGSPGYYAATNLGELFVNLDPSTSIWTLRNSGLPKQPITGIATDPVNRLTAYITVGGTGTGAGHVFATVNGGLTWTNITANLPDVSANAIAFDPDINPTYPQGRLFVGTDSGVYISSNLGKSWQRLGQGMPNVPVVGLQFSQTAQTLVAATNGRGAFTLSTDLNGPRIINVTPPVVAGPGLHSVTFTFNKPINPGTFIPANVTFVGPDGLVTIASMTDVTPSGATAHTIFKVVFGDQVDPGTYTLTVGPNVTDLIDTSTNLSNAGNKMDQNQNGFKGEPGADTFTTHFNIGVDVNVPALITQVKQTGQFVVSISNGVNGFTTSVWGQLNSGLTYQFTNTGDFNGDGLADVVTYVPSTGQWFVGISNGSSFNFGQWAVTNPGTRWADVQVGDFNGDGKMDLVGRDLTTGVWYVGLSTGSSFIFTPWAYFNPGLTFSNIRVGDFNGDGKADLLIYTVESQGNGIRLGEWLVAQSTGSNFMTTVWAISNPSLTYTDVQVGDFTGTGRLGFLTRTVETGEIYVGLSTGTSFQIQLWGQLDPTFTYEDLRVGDVNGDGKLDFVVRAQQTGVFFAGQSTGSSFNVTPFTTWNPGIHFADVFLADLNGDGLADLTGRDPATGIRYAALSTGGSFTSPAAVWEQLNVDLTFLSVLETNKI